MSRIEKAPLGTTAEYSGVHQAEWSRRAVPVRTEVRAELSMDIEPLNLSTAPVGTKDGDTRFRRLRCVSDGTGTLGDNGGVQQAEWSSQDRGGQTD